MAVEGLAGANLIVGVLNLVPGLPLDGGRVLKSVVWGATGDMLKGTVVAAWTGRMTAVAALAWPLVQERCSARRPTSSTSCIAGMVALFLWTAAIVGADLRAGPQHPARAGRPPARPPGAGRPRRPAAGRGRPPGARGRGGQPDHGDRQRPPRSAWSARPRWSPRPRNAAPGSRSPTVARTIEPGMSLPAGIEGEQLVRAMSDHPGPRVPPGRGRRHASTACCRPPTSSGPSATPAAALTGAPSLSSGRARPPGSAPRPAPRRASRGLGRRAPRAAAGGRVGAPGRRQGPPPQLLPRARQALLLQPRPPRARRADRPRGGLHRHLVRRRRVPRLPARCSRSSWSRCRAARRSSTPRTPPRSSRWPTSSPAPTWSRPASAPARSTCSLLRAVGPARAGAVVRAPRGVRRGRPPQRDAVLRGRPPCVGARAWATWPRRCPPRASGPTG